MRFIVINNYRLADIKKGVKKIKILICALVNTVFLN